MQNRGIAAAAKQIPFDALNRGCITSGDSFFVRPPLGIPELRTGPPPAVAEKVSLPIGKKMSHSSLSAIVLRTLCHACCAKG